MHPNCSTADFCLLQDAAPPIAQLSQALLQLSMSYEAVYLIFELPDSVLQVTVKQLPYLQQVAAVVGVKLQIMISFSAANTQVRVMRGYCSDDLPMRQLKISCFESACLTAKSYSADNTCTWLTGGYSKFK